MADKSRSHPGKADRAQRGMGPLNKRVDVLAQALESFRQKTEKEFKAVRQEMKQGFKSIRHEMKQEFQSVRHEMTQEFQSVRHEMTQEFQSVRHEMAQGLEHQGLEVQKQINALAGQIAENEQRDAQFRNSMLTAVDFVMKEYESFRQEKAALGAGQDRLQKDVDQLKEADHQQNKELRSLDERVHRLESA
ncbi:MAG: hypothetical protein ACREOO_04180 [bacterium]